MEHQHDASVRKQIFTLPNGITALRLLGVAFMAYLFTHNHLVAGGIVAACALLSDWLDGYLARTYGWTTTFGARFDVLTDKALLAVLLVPLFMEPLRLTDTVLLYLGCAVALFTAGFQLGIHAKGKRVSLSRLEKSPVILSMCGITMHHLFGSGPVSQSVVATALVLWVVVTIRILRRTLV